ncbi:MAG: AAA family ATPase [Treponema sp.]|nr:AAA family ATPase [Treponema sp.]MCL2191528.1 AAA family ATPase [Treponema sp.]
MLHDIRFLEELAVPSVAGTVGKRRYWLYAPGEDAWFWDEACDSGIMGIGWDEVGDLSNVESKESVRVALQKLYNTSEPYTNNTRTLWQFAKDISTGDIVFAKPKILGCGIVDSDYVFDATRSHYKHVRKIKWTHKDEWNNPLQQKLPQKTLTEVTRKGLLLRKKNVILQGSPGVGKTFTAQRLAFSIMGKKDRNRIGIVQFHQSYSYEDFIMGFRPDGSGFRLVDGPFYKFCKTAGDDDDDHPYFFIIDEINRGNLKNGDTQA